MNPDKDFTPALGRHELTGDYDRVIAVMTRERRWRAEQLRLTDPQPDDVIVDVGCGTGSFAILLKQAATAAQVVGIDPDKNVLALARAKSLRAGLTIDWRCALGNELGNALGGLRPTKIVSSLVFHQCSLDMKRAILREMHTVLQPGGTVVIADYSLQRTFLMRMLFRQVQALDGFENTQPNAGGVLPELITQAGFLECVERRVIQTPTGSISLFTACRGGTS